MVDMRSNLMTCLAAAVALAASATVADAADAEAGKAKAQEVCAACHGPDGISQAEGVPSLAGQPDGFIQWQLVFFRSGRRQNEIMQPIAAALRDADIRNLAAYFSAMPPPGKASEEADDRPDLANAGAAIAAQNRCASCHKEDFSGQQATARLAGQREDVLLKALRDFKSGARTGGGVAAMPEAVAPLEDGDMEALAHYLARLP